MNEQSRQAKIDRLETLMQELPQRMSWEAPDEWPEYELTMSQFKTLTLLQSGPKRMGDISRYLGISLSSATNLVSRLESKALVQREHDLSDRRVVTCELTEEGLKTVTLLWQIGRQRFIHLASTLTLEELDHVVTAFELLNAAAEREHASNTRE